MIRGRKVEEALDALPFVEKNAALPIMKVVKSAAANATSQQGVNLSDLNIVSIEINEGPRLKRFRPVSRGQAHGYIRQMSHIRVIVGAADKAKVKAVKEPEVKVEDVKTKK